MLLKDDYHDVDQSDVDFVIRLAGMVPAPIRERPRGSITAPEFEGPIVIKFGSEGVDPRSNEEVTYVLNEQGTSPHLAILGKTSPEKREPGWKLCARLQNR